MGGCVVDNFCWKQEIGFYRDTGIHKINKSALKSVFFSLHRNHNLNLNLIKEMV